MATVVSAAPVSAARGYWDRVGSIAQQRWDQMIAGPSAGYIPNNPDINADAVRTGYVAGNAAAAIKGVLNGRLTGSGSNSGSNSGSYAAPADVGSGSGSGSPGFDYIDADYARQYGMDRNVAYQEALSNSAYQRAVKDMQAAGLNPAAIFGAGRGSAAGGVSYIDTGSTGSDGSNSGSVGRAGRTGNLFSTSAYSVLSALGGIVGAAATKSAGGYWIGTSLTQGAMSALNAFSKLRR